MEPRSFDRGKMSVSFHKYGPIKLQWSRDRLIAERKETDPRLPSPTVASMEPRSFDRGKASIDLRRRLLACRASMEPRSFDRGKLTRQSRPHQVRLASMEPRSFDRGKKGYN